MRGVVVDIKDTHAVILKADGTFEEIKNKNYKVGQQVKTTSDLLSKSMKIAVCIALCVISSALAHKIYYTPYSCLYIDINPSLRLDLNCFDKVIACTPLNKDAEFIEIASTDVETSINEVIEKCEEKGFLTAENNEIEINISRNDEAVRKSVLRVEKKFGNYTVVIKETTEKEVERANEHGISVKRQRKIDEFSNLYGGATTENMEKLKDKTNKEIDEMISGKKLHEELTETTVVEVERIQPVSMPQKKQQATNEKEQKENLQISNDKSVEKPSMQETKPDSEILNPPGIEKVSPDMPAQNEEERKEEGDPYGEDSPPFRGDKPDCENGSENCDADIDVPCEEKQHEHEKDENGRPPVNEGSHENAEQPPKEAPANDRVKNRGEDKNGGQNQSQFKPDDNRPPEREDVSAEQSGNKTNDEYQPMRTENNKRKDTQ
ncbi:MAG: hypothetical protein E7471_01830 [Ruminococcaceae bacterium]|nr:hypothetical protein [Oscillospiraceae bacterium]